ncbi:MAG: hypothetical protein ABUL49_02190, partial [bacterium]
VLIVGTGLTFIDIVLTLIGRGHTGRIVAISRNGQTPCRHAPTTPRSFDAEEIPSHRFMSWLIVQAKAAGDDWRGVIDAVRPHTQRIWSSWSWEQRRRFIAHMVQYWDVRRHRMPPEAADKLDGMVRSGWVEIKRAYLPKVDGSGSRLALEFGWGREEFDRVISCTGPDMYWQRQRIPILESCVAAGLAEYDPLGIGLMVDDDGRVGSSGSVWAIGNLCRGCRWETTAIPELRVQAHRLGECVLG